MSCDVGEMTERLENEQSSFSNLSVTSPTSPLILQPFRRFTYTTAHSPTLALLHLRHSLFSNPSFDSPTSQALHLRHLASSPCIAFDNYRPMYTGENHLILPEGQIYVFSSHWQQNKWFIFCIKLHFIL